MGPESVWVEHESAPGGPYIEPTRHLYYAREVVTPSRQAEIDRKKSLHTAAKARRAKAKRGGKR